MEPYIVSSIPDRVVLAPPRIQLLDDPEFEVKGVLESKIVCKKLYYLIDWLGYTPNDRAWELVENLDNATNHVVQFHCQYPDKSSRRSCITTQGTRHRRRGMMSGDDKTPRGLGSLKPITSLKRALNFSHYVLYIKILLFIFL